MASTRTRFSLLAKSLVAMCVALVFPMFALPASALLFEF